MKLRLVNIIPAVVDPTALAQRNGDRRNPATSAESPFTTWYRWGIVTTARNRLNPLNIQILGEC